MFGRYMTMADESYGVSISNMFMRMNNIMTYPLRGTNVFELFVFLDDVFKIERSQLTESSISSMACTDWFKLSSTSM